MTISHTALTLSLLLAPASAQGVAYQWSLEPGAKSVASAGDVDGDGVPDFAIATKGLGATLGRVDVRSGRSGDLVWTAPGATPGDGFGASLAALGDIDGDGRDEIVVVRSYLQRGAATAVFGLREDSVVLLAESEPIGAPNRWLNPAGFPDLDGDGRLEVAVVTTPHIGGTLRIYRFTGTSLEPAYAQEGFSNHVLGSRELALATVTDLDRDGRHELILPADGRQVIYQVALARDGSLRTWRFGRHADAVSTAIVAGDFDSDGRIEVLYGLSDGRLVFCSP